VAHVQLFIHQYLQVLLGRAALKLFIPQPLLIVGVVLTQVQDLALGLIEPHEVHTGPLLELVQVPLDDLRPSGGLTAPLSLVSSADLLEDALDLAKSLMKMLHSTSPNTDP